MQSPQDSHYNDPSKSRRFLIATGTSRYRYLSDDAQLPSVNDDVRLMVELFTQKLGYKRVLPQIGVNPTWQRVHNNLSQWFARSARTPSDVVVLYYSGHGLVTENNRHYLLTTEQKYFARELRLKTMLASHEGFLNDRLESFVGRQAELAELRQRIAKIKHSGGYITITGQAGQGKSSTIAKLIEEYGVEKTAFHFIPFNPGPDHQVELLRNLMARLILKYGLPDLYVASESRPALRNYFPNVLKEVAEKGGQEVIFIDGLDQIEEDFTGIRDLSFLPNNPPSGIVFVLGTRPNDTLRPLELLKPHFEYHLPNLGRQDFDLILQHRNVQLNNSTADQFYRVMQENALYLDLVAKELAATGAISPEKIITQIVYNPENLFSLSMTRLALRFLGDILTGTYGVRKRINNFDARACELLLPLVQHEWLLAATRTSAIEQLRLAKWFILFKPEIGIAFCQAFTWVDDSYTNWCKQRICKRQRIC